MPFVNVVIHSVWETKSRYPFLRGDVLARMLNHIQENAKAKRIRIIKMNGTADHIHCLYNLDKEMTISKTLQLLKGESSFWANKVKLTKQHFDWGDEYYAVSVSPSAVQHVIKYIDNQQEHHRQKTFEEEYQEFLKSLGLD